MSRGRPSKRQVILEAATELFIKQGYQGTSIDMVVKAAGVSKPTVYNNFSTKLALLSDMIDDVVHSLLELQTASLAAGAGLTAVVSAYQMSCRMPKLLMLYRVRIGESHKLDDDITVRLAALDSQLSTWALQVLKQAGVEEKAGNAVIERLKARYLLANLCDQPSPNDESFANELAAFLSSESN